MFYTNKMYYKKPDLKKYAIMSKLVNRIQIPVGKIAINTPNYKSVDFPKIAGYW